MNSSVISGVSGRDLPPSHAEIAQCARELWLNSGRPGGRDDEIWLEAERRLISARPCQSLTCRTPSPVTEHALAWCRAGCS